MTTFEWADPIPGWDLMKWKEETQAEIYEEVKDMTPEERIAYFRQGSEEFRKEQEQLHLELKK